MVGNTHKKTTPKAPNPPKLVNRRENRNANYKLGRTIGETRERLETANERAAARKKDKRKKTARICFTIISFLILAVILIVLFFLFSDNNDSVQTEDDTEISFSSNIEIIDEDATPNSQITSRMNDYIAKTEKDLHDLGYTAVKAVIPTGTIREVDFYLDGYTGRIKTTIDRDSAITAEDTDRMLRYLAEKGIIEFEYIDVRIDGKAYWK